MKNSKSVAVIVAHPDLLYKGLLELGVDAHAVHFKSAQEKEWYYRWFQPDVVVGVGYWGHTPQLVLHLVATKKYKLAEAKLIALSRLVKIAKTDSLTFGFNG